MTNETYHLEDDSTNSAKVLLAVHLYAAHGIDNPNEIALEKAVSMGWFISGEEASAAYFKALTELEEFIEAHESLTEG